MDKPLSLVLEDTRVALVDCINQSGLSATLLEPIIKDIYLEIVEGKKQEYLRDKKLWEGGNE